MGFLLPYRFRKQICVKNFPLLLFSTSLSTVILSVEIWPCVSYSNFSDRMIRKWCYPLLKLCKATCPLVTVTYVETAVEILILPSCCDLSLAKTSDLKDIQSWSHLVQSYIMFDRFSFWYCQSDLVCKKRNLWFFVWEDFITVKKHTVVQKCNSYAVHLLFRETSFLWFRPTVDKRVGILK